MALIRAQTSWPLFGSGSEQSMSNTLHFVTLPALDEAEPAQLTEILARVAACYAAVDQHIYGPVNPGTVTLYDLAEPEPRVPISVTPISPSWASAANAMPSEVALVLSYRAAYFSGEARARLRGRIFFGPMHTNSAQSTTPPGSVRPLETVLSALRAAGTALATPVVESNVIWVQYSPTNAEWRVVVECSTDNSFDTMRSRGIQPTLRNVTVIEQA